VKKTLKEMTDKELVSEITRIRKRNASPLPVGLGFGVEVLRREEQELASALAEAGERFLKKLEKGGKKCRSRKSAT
jgi:hypothetical protein